MKKSYHWSILLLLIPIFFLAMPIPVNNSDFCISRSPHAPIVAVNGQDIKLDTITGGSQPCITVPNGTHDVHIHKCKLIGSTASTGAIFIGSGCFNITVDSNVITTSVRGVFARLATNNIVVRYNEFLDMADPNIYTNGGGSSVQFNQVNGSGNRINRNYSYHTFTSIFIGDQFSLYQSNGVPGDPIQVDSNQMVNGSSKPEGDVGVDLADGGGTYQEGNYNYCVNCGSSAAQVSGGSHINLSFNWAYGAQTTYTNAGFGYNTPGTTTDHTTVTIGNNHSQWTLKNGAVLNYYYDPAVGGAPVNWGTNINDPTLNTGLLPNPLFGTCSSPPPPPSPPNITYTTPHTYTTGIAITPLTVTNTGGPVSFFSATTSLPAGLSLNLSTGTISGTPTVQSGPLPYKITATNAGGSSIFTITLTTVLPVPIINYPTPNVYTVGNVITLSPTNTGGSPLSYAISPAGPASTIFNTSTGVLSGTVTAVQGATNYTISATNSGGTGTKVISIQVNNIAPPVFTYLSPQIYTAGTTIGTLSPIVTTGPVNSYSVLPALPAGLSLNTATGGISGTPTAATPIVTYVITGLNSGGSHAFNLTITVNPPPIVVPSFSYAPLSNSYIIGSVIPPLSPVNVGGPVVSYSISPALPSSLSFNTVTGVISGTASALSGTVPYTITGVNASGTGVGHVSLQIVPNPISAPVIAYNAASYTFTYGTAIPALNSTNSGSPVISWSVSPALPPGLSLNILTGQITGVPQVVQGSSAVVVTATNSAGVGHFTINFTVNKANISLLANNLQKAQNTLNPVLTYTSIGLLNGDTYLTAFTAQPSLATTAVTGSPAGPYPITISGGTSNKYNITARTNGTLTVVAPGRKFHHPHFTGIR